MFSRIKQTLRVWGVLKPDTSLAYLVKKYPDFESLKKAAIKNAPAGSTIREDYEAWAEFEGLDPNDEETVNIYLIDEKTGN